MSWVTVAKSVLYLRLSVRWWVPIYINTLAFACRVCGAEPDADKAWRVLRHGFKIGAVDDRAGQ